MSPFLVILSLAFNVNSQLQNYCVWNHITTQSDINVNGQYTFYATVNGQPSYVKSIGPNCYEPTLYLWRNAAGTAWQISDTTTTIYPLLQCSKSVLTRCIAGSWGASNPTVYVQSGFCPEWECASITSTVTAHTDTGCRGPFDEYVAPNAWKHRSKEVYFYFVPHVFKWMCSGALQQTTCPVKTYMSSDAGWVALSEGQSINLIFSWLGDSVKEFGTFQVNCIAPNPTKSPTVTATKGPTRQPTVNPTKPPTRNPTKQSIVYYSNPTTSPTQKPPIRTPDPTRTDTPTQTPSVMPIQTDDSTIHNGDNGESVDVDAEENGNEDYSDVIRIVGVTFERTSFFWGTLFGVVLCSCGCCMVLLCQKMCSSDKGGRERVYSDEQAARVAELAYCN